LQFPLHTLFRVGLLDYTANNGTRTATTTTIIKTTKSDKGEQTTLGLIINVLRDKERESRSIRKQQPAKEQKRKQQTSKKKTAKGKPKFQNSISPHLVSLFLLDFSLYLF